jgi:hypothetical protein
MISLVSGAPRDGDDDDSEIGCCKCFTVAITETAATNKITGRDLDCIVLQLASLHQRKSGARGEDTVQASSQNTFGSPNYYYEQERYCSAPTTSSTQDPTAPH